MLCFTMLQCDDDSHQCRTTATTLSTLSHSLSFNLAFHSLSLSLFSTMVLFILPSRRRARCQRNTSNHRNHCSSQSSRTEEYEKNGKTLRSFRQASSLRTLLELQGWYRWYGCAKLSTFVHRSIPRVASFEVRSCCCSRCYRDAGSSRSVEACDSVPNPLASTSWRQWWYNFSMGSRDGAARSDRLCYYY